MVLKDSTFYHVYQALTTNLDLPNIKHPKTHHIMYSQVNNRIQIISQGNEYFMYNPYSGWDPHTAVPGPSVWVSSAVMSH